jgi:predicted MFS family arabinose efflux permease
VALLLALGTWFALLAAAGSPVAVALLLALAGTAIGPATIVASTLLDRVTPPGAATEAFAAMVMAIVAGTAAGNALGGDLVDAASYATATLVAGAIVAFSAAIAVARRGTLGGRTTERGR